MTSEQRTLTLA